MTKKQILKFIFCLSVLLLALGSLALHPKQGQALEDRISFTWSTNTYIPFDYPGKALPVPGSTIEIIANLKEKSGQIRKSDFNWFLDNKLQRHNSGKGKQVYNISVPMSGSILSVKLEIRKEGNLWATKSLNINVVKPQIVMHAKQNVLPAITEYAMKSHQQINFIALPYFFNIKNIHGLDYLWTFNGQKSTITDDENPEILALKIGELLKPITRSLKVLVKNKDNFSQKAQAQTKIIITP